MTEYQTLRQPRHEILRVRGLDMHLTRWGPPPSVAAPPVFLLHGWLDSGETFQFMVDAFKKDRALVALDWRGFGRSEWPQEGYGFPDYIGDLDALMDELTPFAPACIVGHSMGGNIANLVCGPAARAGALRGQSRRLWIEADLQRRTRPSACANG